MRTGLEPPHVRRHWRVLVDAGDGAPSAWAVDGRQALIAAAQASLVAVLLAGVLVALLPPRYSPGARRPQPLLEPRGLLTFGSPHDQIA